MRAECMREVARAIGRDPTVAEATAIADAIQSNMRRLAKADPGKWSQMSRTDRWQEAARLAAADRIAAANKAADRRAANIAIQSRETDRLNARAAELAARGVKNPHHAALFERIRVADNFISGTRNEILNGLIPAIDAVSPKFFGMLHDEASVRDFARAVLDGNTSNPEMARAAKVYVDQMESARIRANAAGADIGQLDYSYMPQPHDTGAIARAGADKWVADTMPLLDRSRYVNASGTRLDDAQVDEFLRAAWETLATEGRNKLTPGQAGGGSRASRFDDQHRSIHFKDADSYLSYNATYGRGSAMEGILGHVGQMAKTIALLEEFGPNPNSTYRILKDTAAKADNAAGVHEFGATTDMVWDTLNGATSQPVNPGLARFFQGVRNFTAATKLQGVMLSAITDVPLQVIVAKSSGMPMGDALGTLFKGWGSSAKDQARSLAIGMDEIAGEMARWHGDHLAQGWTSKMANATMKLTLVEAWTNSLRRGFGLQLSGTLGRMVKTDWGSLDAGDRARFEAAGVTKEDWAIWQKAQISADGLLTKDGIRSIAGISDADANRSVARLLGYIDAESKMAVLSPDIHTRAAIQQGTKSGTVGGEVLRSLMLFKSFGLAIVMQHARRIKNIPTTYGKGKYSVAMLTTLTLFGAAVVQIKDLINGKDPRDMASPKFWAAAFMQGGGIGVFGDILYTGMGGDARGGQANWTSLAGPVFGNAFDAMNVARKGAGWMTADEQKEGKAAQQFGAEALRFAKSNTPFVNLWYLRSAVDHAVMHDLQEQLSPGYLSRMKRRARKEYGQGFWWEPGEAMPERAPDMSTATGG